MSLRSRVLSRSYTSSIVDMDPVGCMDCCHLAVDPLRHKTLPVAGTEGYIVRIEDTLRRVHARNPDSLWGIFRQSAGAPPAMIGFCTFLILNAAGAKALLRRRLDVKRVDIDLIAPAPVTVSNFCASPPTFTSR